MTVKSENRNRASTLLLISIGGAVLTMFIHLTALHIFLPGTDGAKEVPFYLFYFDPFVLTVAIPFMLLSAAAAFAFSLFTLKYCNLRRTVPIVFGAVFGAVILLAPVGSLLALAGGWAAMTLSMLLCREKYGTKPSLTS